MTRVGHPAVFHGLSIWSYTTLQSRALAYSVSDTPKPIYCHPNRESDSKPAIQFYCMFNLTSLLQPSWCHYDPVWWLLNTSGLHEIACSALALESRNWTRKICPVPSLRSSCCPSSVMLFWGCWRSVYPEQIRYFYSFSLILFFFLPDLLENWSSSGFNCLTFWHIICRADLYDCTGRECLWIFELLCFILFVKILPTPD